MIKKKIKLSILLGIIFLSFFLFFIIKGKDFSFWPRLKNWENLAVENFLEKIKKQIITPPPLKWEKEEPSAYLTKDGVIFWTNQQRKNFNLLPLKENQKLNEAARKKIEDMFTYQYFAHVSPQGKGPSFWVESVGYQYIIVGENLALGDFKNDKNLVEAWMESPGHRENILNPKYKEIGVAVKKGLIEGRYTWLAVQVFAKPLSDCPQPSANLKNQIENLKKELTTLENQLLILKSEIETLNPYSSQYNKKVQEYNNLVTVYNEKLSLLKSLINQYNQQVKILNDCIAG